MTIRLTRSELGVWAGLAFIAGFIPANPDLPAVVVQGPGGLLLLNFALTLPGRAPVWLVAPCTWVAPLLLHVITQHHASWTMLLGLVPALIGATGGWLAGKLLDTAASQLTELRGESDRPWLERPLSTRFLLATALVLIASIGHPSAVANLRLVTGGSLAGGFIGPIWQIMTLLGWIGCAPMILSQRPILRRPAEDSAAGIRPLELLTHLLVIFMLAVVHATAMVTICALLGFPMEPSWPELVQTAFRIYLPLDVLAYLTILALGFASDAERHRRETEQREAAFNAQAVSTRLSALRARLNPHFLFNALNSVTVLARAGRAADTARIVEGLTGLLRYVLDERQAMVPLRDELDFVRRYLEVQQVRFGGRLQYDIRSEAAAGNFVIPQLLLQPIVENAVEHGVAQTLNGGRVVIAATMGDETLMVTVDDDGPGPGQSSSRNGIGLTTTRERLDQLYAHTATLMIERRPAGGTHVEIALPLPAAHA